MEGVLQDGRGSLFVLSTSRDRLIADEANYCSVISELDNGVGFGIGSTVVSEQCEQQRTEHTPTNSVCSATNMTFRPIKSKSTHCAVE